MKKVRTFGISLPRCKDRYHHIQEQLLTKVKDNFEILGVDGMQITRGRQSAGERSPATKSLSPGQIGCALSHLAVYRRMEKLNLPYAFVVEDDVILPDNIESIIEECVWHLPRMGVISLYSPRPRITKYTSRSAPKLSSGALLSPTRTLDTHTTTAYLITTEAARNIRRCNDPVSHLADHWFAFYEAGAIDKVLLHYPMPVRVAHFESSIGYISSGKISFKNELKRFKLAHKLIKLKRAYQEYMQMKNIRVVDEPSFYETQRGHN